MNSQILLLSFLAMFFYGVGGPLQAYVLGNGATKYGLLQGYAIGALIVIIADSWWSKSEVALSYNSKATAMILVYGIMCSAANILLSYAYKIPGANVATISVIVGCFPFVGAVTAMLCIKGTLEKTNLTRFSIGSLLLFAALYFIITSEKQTTSR